MNEEPREPKKDSFVIRRSGREHEEDLPPELGALLNGEVQELLASELSRAKQARPIELVLLHDSERRWMAMIALGTDGLRRIYTRREYLSDKFLTSAFGVIERFQRGNVLELDAFVTMLDLRHYEATNALGVSITGLMEIEGFPSSEDEQMLMTNDLLEYLAKEGKDIISEFGPGRMVPLIKT